MRRLQLMHSLHVWTVGNLLHLAARNSQSKVQANSESTARSQGLDPAAVVNTGRVEAPDHVTRVLVVEHRLCAASFVNQSRDGETLQIAGNPPANVAMQQGICSAQQVCTLACMQTDEEDIYRARAADHPAPVRHLVLQVETA